ncbi:unnamed protein product, partial [Iphiclides podalirius]
MYNAPGVIKCTYYPFANGRAARRNIVIGKCSGALESPVLGVIDALIALPERCLLASSAANYRSQYSRCQPDGCCMMHPTPKKAEESDVHPSVVRRHLSTAWSELFLCL